MIHRIEKIMTEKNISVGQFADLLEVQRSGMSHIMSGRNNPSLHFVKRILEVYPDINPKWLLFGEGEMYSKTDNSTSSTVNSGKETQQKSSAKNEKSKKDPIETEKRTNATIEKIIICYSDKTFEVSFPQKIIIKDELRIF